MAETEGAPLSQELLAEQVQSIALQYLRLVEKQGHVKFPGQKYVDRENNSDLENFLLSPTDKGNVVNALYREHPQLYEKAREHFPASHPDGDQLCPLIQQAHEAEIDRIRAMHDNSGILCNESEATVLAAVLGPDGSKCYQKLEDAVHAKKGKDAIKSARDNCGQTRKGPKPADIAQKTGVIEPRVKEILVVLRVRIVQKKQRCKDILEAANKLLSTPAADGDAQTETHGSHVPTVEQPDENGGDVQIPAATSPAADGDAQTETHGSHVPTVEQPETEQPGENSGDARIPAADGERGAGANAGAAGLATTSTATEHHSNCPATRQDEPESASGVNEEGAGAFATAPSPHISDEDRLGSAIAAFRRVVIGNGEDEQTVMAWSPERLARECFGYSTILPLRTKLFPNEPVDPQAPFSATNHPGFVDFCRRRFPSDIPDAQAVEEEESPTGPPRRARSQLADDAAMDEQDQNSSDDECPKSPSLSDSEEEPTRAKSSRVQFLKTKAVSKSKPGVRKKPIAKKQLDKHRFKKGPLSGEELYEQLDKLAAANRGLTDANGDTITSEHYKEVMRKEKNARNKKKWAKKVNMKVKGGYLAAFDVEKSKGGKRQCMHDTAVNAATRVGTHIDIKQLLREVPLRGKETNYSLNEIMSAPCVASVLDFERINVNWAKGGNEAALISIEDGGVYFVLAKVKGRRTEFHAFVYDSTGTVPNEKPHSGLLIDNRKNDPVFLIEDSDRASVESKRKLLNDFFNGRTSVLQVYRVTKKNDDPDREEEADKCRATFDAIIKEAAATADTVATVKARANKLMLKRGPLGFAGRAEELKQCFRYPNDMDAYIQSFIAVAAEQQADAQDISDYKRKQRESGTATGAYDYIGNDKTDEIDLTNSPPAKKVRGSYT